MKEFIDKYNEEIDQAVKRINDGIYSTHEEVEYMLNLWEKNMKLETIVKTTEDGGINIPSDMNVGDSLLNMVKELQKNGWRTFNHHDNWIKVENYPNPTSDQQFDTGGAYRIMKNKK